MVGGDLMPKVGKKKFPYTKAGQKAAKKQAQRTGKRVVKTGRRKSY